MAMSTVATAEIPPTRCDEYFVPQKNRTKPPLNGKKEEVYWE
jgi:hypothetical protein